MLLRGVGRNFFYFFFLFLYILSYIVIFFYFYSSSGNNILKEKKKIKAYKQGDVAIFFVDIFASYSDIKHRKSTLAT